MHPACGGNATGQDPTEQTDRQLIAVDHHALVRDHTTDGAGARPQVALDGQRFTRGAPGGTMRVDQCKVNPTMRLTPKAFLRRLVNPAPPKELALNFRPLDAVDRARLTDCLRRHYFTRQVWASGGLKEGYLESDLGRKDMADHLTGRLDEFRTRVVPWLNDARPLRGARVLEIGCGTGSSTVALAEQGATVSAIDIDASSLAVAKERCSTYGLQVDFQQLNAEQTADLFAGCDFDFIIFFAALEHMTHAERMAAMRGTWNMLAKGKLWVVIETPNRLWYFDEHTSLLPFFMWLPDDLALAYAKNSPREAFAYGYASATDADMMSLLRHGRGVSYHEFELAFLSARELQVVSSLESYLGGRSSVRRVSKRMKKQTRYSSMIHSLSPQLHPGFFEPWLDLIIRK